MDFSTIDASSSNNWTGTCIECTVRAVTAHLQGQQDWYGLSGDVGHCHVPFNSGLGLVSPPASNDCGTPSLSPEELLVDPLSTFTPDASTEFVPEVAAYPPNWDQAMSREDKKKRPQTLSRMRRREQNRESQRRFRERKDSYTKQLEKKVHELEELAAGLQSEVVKLAQTSIHLVTAEDGPQFPSCARCRSEEGQVSEEQHKLEKSAMMF